MSSDTKRRKQPKTLSLAEIREGAKRASARFEEWPAWKRQVSEAETVSQRGTDSPSSSPPVNGGQAG